MKDFKIDSEHLGEYKMNTEKHGFNTIVVAGPSRNPDIDNVGRLLQVRKKSGAFGSDTILIRQLNGEIMCWENQGFFSISPEFQDFYDNLFKDIEMDKENREYTICGKHKAKGFIVNGMDCTNGDIFSSNMVITVNKNK